MSSSTLHPQFTGLDLCQRDRVRNSESVVPTQLPATRYCGVCRASYPVDFEACPRDGARLQLTGDPLIGEVLNDSYRITSFLGEGGLGRVYRAEHTRMPRTYAVKFPHGVWVDHPKARARFRNEAIAAGRLDHPNIAAVVDRGELAGGMPYLVMQFARGESLHEFLRERRGLPVEHALALARQIALGLEHAHSLDVVHRDLKPDNVMIEAGRVRIVDFGISILTDLGDSGRFTTRGVVIGTPYYMAPEQLLAGPIDARADLYTLGVMLYEMLAGSRPFLGNAVESAHRTVTGHAPKFAQRAPWLVVPPAVEDLCQELLARYPSARIASASEVISRIDAIDVRYAQT